jgi:DNA-binding MarR family transcriptional regulator
MISPLTLNEIRTLLMLGHKLALREIEQRASAVWPNASALQIAVLRHLDVQARTMSELSARLMATSSTLVATVDKLEAEGLLVRTPDPNDRRRTPLALTPKGRKLLGRIRPDDYDALQRSLDAMGEAKAEKLLKLLHELVAGMQTEDGLVDRMLENARDRAARHDVRERRA